MILTRVDLPAPFSPSKAWISLGHRSRSMASLARNVPNFLLTPMACTSGPAAGKHRASEGSPGAGSRIVYATQFGAGVTAPIVRERASHRLANDQKLRHDRRGDCGGRLVADLGEADRTGKALDGISGNADLAHCAREAGA